MSTPLSAPESARRIGVHCWLEQQAFARFGAWVSEITEPAAKLAMLRLGENAGWRAQRWYELLPTAPPGADALVAGTPQLDAVIATMGFAPDTSPIVDAFAAAAALLGLIDRAVAEHVDRTTAIAEPALVRIAGIARTDIFIDLGSCHAVLEVAQDRSDPMAANRLAAIRAPFEALPPLDLLTSF
jgi:hypothetical protein